MADSATTIAHALVAVEEALTESTGAPRALDTSELFSLGLPPGVDIGVRARNAFAAGTRKTCFVGLADRDALEDLELGADHLYQISISISRDYWLGWEGSASYGAAEALAEAKQALIREADDFMRIRAALCYPDALRVTAASDATGLVGGALQGVAARSRPRIESIGSDVQQRLLTVTDTFVARFLFNPDG